MKWPSVLDDVRCCALQRFGKISWKEGRETPMIFSTVLTFLPGLFIWHSATEKPHRQTEQSRPHLCRKPSGCCWKEAYFNLLQKNSLFWSASLFAEMLLSQIKSWFSHQGAWISSHFVGSALMPRGASSFSVQWKLTFVCFIWAAWHQIVHHKLSTSVFNFFPCWSLTLISCFH